MSVGCLLCGRNAYTSSLPARLVLPHGLSRRSHVQCWYLSGLASAVGLQGLRSRFCVCSGRHRPSRVPCWLASNRRVKGRPLRNVSRWIIPRSGATDKLQDVSRWICMCRRQCHRLRCWHLFLQRRKPLHCLCSRHLPRCPRSDKLHQRGHRLLLLCSSDFSAHLQYGHLCSKSRSNRMRQLPCRKVSSIGRSIKVHRMPCGALLHIHFRACLQSWHFWRRSWPRFLLRLQPWVLPIIKRTNQLPYLPARPLLCGAIHRTYGMSRRLLSFHRRRGLCERLHHMPGRLSVHHGRLHPRALLSRYLQHGSRRQLHQGARGHISG